MAILGIKLQILEFLGWNSQPHSQGVGRIQVLVVVTRKLPFLIGFQKLIASGHCLQTSALGPLTPFSEPVKADWVPPFLRTHFSNPTWDNSLLLVTDMIRLNSSTASIMMSPSLGLYLQSLLPIPSPQTGPGWLMNGHLGGRSILLLCLSFYFNKAHCFVAPLTNLVSPSSAFPTFWLILCLWNRLYKWLYILI